MDVPMLPSHTLDDAAVLRTRKSYMKKQIGTIAENMSKQDVRCTAIVTVDEKTTAQAWRGRMAYAYWAPGCLRSPLGGARILTTGDCGRRCGKGGNWRRDASRAV